MDVNKKLKFLGKFTKKKILGGGGGEGVDGVWGGSQGGCEQRIKVFVKIQKKKKLGGGGQGRCNREVVFVKIKKKLWGGVVGSGEGWGGSGWM